MQHDMMRHPAPPPGADNVGDVLASIRRLIAQDEAGCRIPNQALNTLPAQDIAPRIRVEPMQTAPSHAPAMPLVLDSTDLVAAAAQGKEATESTAAVAETPVATATGPETEAAVAAEVVAVVEAEAEVQVAPAARAEPEAQPEPEAEPEPEARAEIAPRDFGNWLNLPLTESDHSSFAASWPQAAEPARSASDADPILPFGPFLDKTTPKNAQMEETMLHANSTVTPINPLAEAHAAAEALNRESEQHLFAPQDKDTQKGTHLRGMIREAIRQELQGEIGTRLSRNLQQMIRQEIELTLRQMCEQE